jgi:hypothetical protein
MPGCIPEAMGCPKRFDIKDFKEDSMRASKLSHHKPSHCLTLLLLAAVFWIPPLLRAQDPPEPKPTPMITIDGSKEPEKIPEWILWLEIFRVATLLDEKSPKAGEDVWKNRVKLSDKEMKQVIARGHLFRDEEDAMDKEAQDLLKAAGKTVDAGTQDKLDKLQAKKEKSLLDHRDLLRDDLGKESFDKLNAFARKEIATTIRVGELFPGPDTKGTLVGPPPKKP